MSIENIVLLANKVLVTTGAAESKSAGGLVLNAFVSDKPVEGILTTVGPEVEDDIKAYLGNTVMIERALITIEQDGYIIAPHTAIVAVKK